MPAKGWRVPDAVRLANYEVMPNGCWHWKGYILRQGYGQFETGDEKWLAHRFFYTKLVGPIPDGLVLDHTCHNESDCVAGDDCLHRRCVNPAHLEPTTDVINIRRGRSANALKTHCPQDHEYTEQSVVSTTGQRLCRQCAAERKKSPEYKAVSNRLLREKRAAKKEQHARIHQQ